jgi:hypothetical protein
MPDRTKFPSIRKGESDPGSPPSRMTVFLRTLIGRALRYSILLSHAFLRKTTKIRIRRPHGEIRINIEYFSYSLEDSHDYSLEGKKEFRDILRKLSFPLLLRGPRFLDFPIGPQVSNEFDTQVEEGTLGSRFEIFSRLSELKREAAAEQIPYSQHSEHDFFKFWLLNPEIVRPYLFLLENGNLRALWKNTDGEQVGLQFRGDELVQYVIFARRDGSRVVSRSAGRDLLSNIDNLLEAHDAEKLMLAAAPG